MSLFNSLQTSISGMNAQSQRVEVVADNIANSSTVGYKRSNVEFETILTSRISGQYSSGGVLARTRHNIGEQGLLRPSTNKTDMAIKGDGFFIVNRPGIGPRLTRAGAFQIDSAGNLINTAGFQLMGIPISKPTAGKSSISIEQLVPINVANGALNAKPSTNARIIVNLPSQSVSTESSSTPALNQIDARYTATNSITVYDNLGRAILLDVYYTKTDNHQWEMTIYNADERSNERFPYSGPPLLVTQLNFDPVDGKLQGPGEISISVPNGQNLQISIGETTQLATNFFIKQASANGAPPSRSQDVVISPDGIVSLIRENGQRDDLFQIVLGMPASVDRMLQSVGNTFQETIGSGPISIGKSGEPPYGDIISSALETSTVDLGTELTAMIESQRNYAANSKVFKTSNDMLEVLMTLKN